MKTIQHSILLIIVLFTIACSNTHEYDVIVYGGTPSGVIASVAAARESSSVLLIEQTRHLGGMNTSGINTAESEHMITAAITGIAEEFYIRLGEKYTPEFFQEFGQGRDLNFQPGDPAYFFESHVAEKVFNEMIAQENVKVLFQKYVESVQKKNGDIKTITFTDGSAASGSIFIDCTYEGDLMARAGVSYTYGREPQSQYKEQYAGIRFMDDTLQARTVNSSGELMAYFTEPTGLVPGAGDNKVMCYNFRPTMTKLPGNKVKITKPENYDPSWYELLSSYLAKYPDTHIWDIFGIYKRGNGKYEFNNKQQAIISLGLFGGQFEYPDAGYEKRAEIYNDHKDYTLGLFYFLGNDPSVPESLREEMLEYGFAADEFQDNDHFPYYLYIREARRMAGEFVGTEHDILENRRKDDAITLGSHWIDSHHVQRVAVSDSSFTNEGRIWHKTTEPYEIPYRILLPRQSETKNLLVPVCASVSHVAFCSLRLESTWMQVGHAAGVAASMAAQHNKNVHNVSIQTLQDKLMSQGMILDIDELSY